MMYKINVLQWRKVSFLFATFFCLLIVLPACKKKDNTIGHNAFNENDLINSTVTDTFEIFTSTVRQDSIKTKNAGYQTIGAYNDQQVGKINASFYSQIGLENAGNTNFGSNPTIDSLVLALQIDGFYGKPEEVTFEVYEINEQLLADKDYYSFSTNTTEPTNLIVPGTETITPKPTSVAIVGTDSLNPQIRLTLSNTLAQRLIDGANQGHYTTQDAFKSFFKGFYVKVISNPSTGKGCIYHLNLNGINSRLSLYYKDDSSTSKSFSYLMSGTNIKYSHVNFDASGTPMKSVMEDSLLGQKEYYALSMYSKALIYIPGINNIPKNVIIHKAEMILPITYYSFNPFAPGTNANIYLREPGQSGNVTSEFTNTAVTFNNSAKQYVFNLKDHLQLIANDSYVHKGFYFMSAAYASKIEKTVLNGQETSNKKKPKLIVTYTTY